VPAGFSRGPGGKLSAAGDEDWHFLMRTPDSEGRLSIFWNDTPVGRGPRLHVHHDVDEWFYVLSGEMVLEVGGKL
jgi:mannose-6-phosphate isomerase-like protein (cupin superfamily)